MSLGLTASSSATSTPDLMQEKVEDMLGYSDIPSEDHSTYFVVTDQGNFTDDQEVYVYTEA